MKLTGILLLVFAIFLAGCGESEPETAEAGSEVSNEVQQYTDVATALSEGRRFLDIGETEKAIDALNQAVSSTRTTPMHISIWASRTRWSNLASR
jgi:hypothetical protein